MWKHESKKLNSIGNDILIIKRLKVISGILSNVPRNSNIDGKKIKLLKESNFIDKYYIVDDSFIGRKIHVHDETLFIVEGKDEIYSKGVYVKSKSMKAYICPMMDSFEHI
uniref:Cupin n=1 Tax=Strongyloides venezuelensis TaxID=75913 RepID=A0A0K0G6B1_STRVS